MPTRQQLIDALGRADAAGDVTAAREIAAMIQGDGAASAAPAAATSPPVAPARPAPDTYLSRSVEGLARGLREAPAAARRALEGASAEFVQGLTFGWADEGVAKGISSITGEPEENIRRDVEGWGKNAGDLALPARILGSALTGGIVGKAVPATTTIIGGVPTAAAGAVLDAVGNAAPGKKLEAAMDPVPPIVGALFGLGVPFGAKYGAQAYHNLADKVNRAVGGAANPYLGKGGLGAQVALSNADDLAQRTGAPPLSGDRSLLEQPAAEGAAGVVKAAGGDPYADMVGAANVMRDKATADLSKAADVVDATAMGQRARAEAQEGSMLRMLGMKAKGIEDEAGKALTAAEQRLTEIGERTAKSGQDLIASVARKLAGKGQNIGRQGVRDAGLAYQNLGIVPVGLRTTPDEILASPNVASNEISSLLENPDVKRIVAGMQRDVAFEGVDPTNLTFLNELTIKLGEEAKGLRTNVPVKADRMDRLRARFIDAMEGAVPGYKEAAAGYRQASTMKSAYDMGYGFDTKAIPKEELDALPPEARAETISAMAQRFSDLIGPQGGQAQTPAQVAALADRLKAKLTLTFGKDAEGFVSSLLDGSRKIQAGRVASDLASRGLAGAKPKKLRQALAPIFPTEADLGAFVETIRGAHAGAKTAKAATGKAAAGFSPESLKKARDSLAGVFKTGDEADEFIASIAEALAKKEQGKVISGVAANMRGGNVDGARDAIARVTGDDAAAALAAPAEDAAERAALAKRIGAGTTGIMPPADPTLLQIARNSISSSLPGMIARGSIASGVHMETILTGKAQQQIAKRLVEILTEKDPAKIQAAVRMLKQDYSGVPWRKFMLMQAPNVQRALEGEQ